MSDFINTIDLLGDDVVMDSIIDRSITEFKDDVITNVGNYAFYRCSKLHTVELPSVTGVGQYAFRYCSELELLLLPELTAVNACMISDTKISKIVLPKAHTFYTNGLRECGTLRIVDLPVATDIGSWQFYGNNAMEALIIRASSVCVISADTFGVSPFTSGKAYIYVPSALVESYKVATNWSVFADQFRALEDYTIDGTITGDLDETKI